jgi:hypothetical protein
MLDFRNECDTHDDPDGYEFLRQYSRFSAVPSAPSLDSFAFCGGKITQDSYRKWWTQLKDAPLKTLRSSASPFDRSLGFCFQSDVPDQYNTGSMVGNGSSYIASNVSVDHNWAVGMSTRRHGGLRLGPGAWGGSTS